MRLAKYFRKVFAKQAKLRQSVRQAAPLFVAESLEARRLLSATFTTIASFNLNWPAPYNASQPWDAPICLGNTLYGTTTEGGAYGNGTVFSLPTTGGRPTVLASFNGTNGDAPMSSVVLDGNILYGTADSGGANNLGTVFSVPVGGGNITVLASCNGSNGEGPSCELTVSGSTLYGTMAGGGAYGDGTVFSLPITGGNISTMASFNGTNGGGPSGLVLSGGTLYGFTGGGGAYGNGTVFSLPVAGGNITTLAAFNGTSNGRNPGEFCIPTLFDDILYGATMAGGNFSADYPLGSGTVFSVPISGGNITTLAELNGLDGDNSQTGVVRDGGILYGTTRNGGANGAGTLYSVPVTGGTPTVVQAFNYYTTGWYVVSGLCSDASGNLYGTAANGGAYPYGTVYEVTRCSPSLTVVPPVNQTASAGQNNSYNLGSLTQSNTTGPYSIDVNWGDGTADTLIGNMASAGVTPPTAHTYADSGQQTVTVTVTDNYGDISNIAMFNVTVAATALATPVFSNLTPSSSLSYGTAAATFSGTIAAGELIPPSSETVAITLNGVTQCATIDSSGNFSSTFNTSSLPSSITPYQVGYTYGGDAGFNSITDGTTTALTVNPAATAIAVTAGNGSVTYNQSATYTATITPASGSGETGTVDFLIDGGNMGGVASVTGNTASYTVSGLQAGNNTVVAVYYSADGNFTGSTSPTFTQDVGKAATVTSVASSNDLPAVGQAVTFTASVGPSNRGDASGTVQFQIDGGNVGRPVAVGYANEATYTTTLSLGSHSIVAIYGGDRNCNPSTSPALSQTVQAGIGTTTAVISSNGSTTYGQSVTFTATITPASGSGETGFVQFVIDGGNVGSPVALSGNTATYATSTLSVGSHAVVAIYSGVGQFCGSTSPEFIQTVTGTGLASIAGTIYSDTNNSGVWTSADPGLPDVMVYLDTNNNGQLDAGEISVNTDANGNYIFSNLSAGNYTVREAAPGGYAQTSPAIGDISVTLADGQTVTGENFLDAPGNATAQAVYRLYSPVTLEHLYTSDPREYNTLESYVGTWNGEGQVFNEYSGNATVGGVADEAYYRLYNPVVKQHLWTTDDNEYTTLATEGWNQEGMVGYVFPTAVPAMASCTPLYRLMAPNVHLWTTTLNEYDTLQTDGWTGEGIIGYVV